jgi:anaerobic magnesium-protoporphyrin IX monomethyl ester cyclase
MKITLINPPSPYLANDAAYPPSGLMYVAAAVEHTGHQAEIVDLTGGIDWRAVVSGLAADLFGITCVTPNFKIVQEIAELLPADTPTVVGGVHPTFLPEDTLNHIRCAAIVRGEAEVAIVQLLKDFQTGALRRIYDGGLVPVEAIPKPSRHLVDLHKYRPGGDEAVPVYSSRGCPFSCNFCAKVTGRTYRMLPVSQVLEEIREVMDRGFRHILFGDDDIAIDRVRLRELLSAVKPLGLGFRLNQDARDIDDEAVRLAAEGGCREISFGIESGSQRMLDLMNKRATVDANRRAIRVTKQHGLRARAYFLVNYPGENEDSIEETLRFAEETRPERWLLSSFAPLPGSDTFCNKERYGITWLSANWEDYYLVGRDGTFRSCFETGELTIDRQISLHNKLFTGLKEILG